MSLTKLSLAGNRLIINFIIPQNLAGDGKTAKLFYSVLIYVQNNYYYGFG
jgi:hypothetical protein